MLRRAGTSEKAWTGTGFRNADEHQITIDLQEVEIGVPVDLGGDRADDQVEAAGELRECLRILRRVVVIRPELKPVLLLRKCLAEHRDLRAHRMGELHAHMAETAQADDRHLLAGPAFQ